MPKVRFTSQAREDLVEIWLYIAARNPAAADRVFDRISAQCQILRDHPLAGNARPDIGNGARALIVDRWVAFYRVLDRDVQIVRIVAGARDLTKLIWNAD